MRNRAYFFGGVLFFATVTPLCAADAPVSIGKPVSWTTDDGVEVAGLYKAPASPGRPVWILLHGLGSDKQEWLNFGSRLAEKGDGFLIYDARGHGDSIHRVDETSIHYKDFKTKGPGSPWDHMANDLDTAVRFLKSRFSLPMRRIGVGGASLGANVALVYASQHREIPAVILLSPGFDYAGVQAEEAFRRYGNRSIFLAASPGDQYAFSTVRKLAVQCPGSNCMILQGEGSAHGVQMLDGAFIGSLLDWVGRIK